MGFDGEAIVQEGGRVTLEGVPYPAGREVSVRVEPIGERTQEDPREGRGRSPAAEAVADLRSIARWLKEGHPHLPVLDERAMSRESIYEDDGP